MNEKFTAFRNKVAANKTRILGTTTVVLTTVVLLQARGIHEHNEFLKKKDLYEEYYTPDADQ